MINSLAAIVTAALMLFNAYTIEPTVEDVQVKEVYTVEFRDSEDNTVIDVNDILRAEAVFGRTSEFSNLEWYVKITFTPTGQEKFKKATAEAVKKIETGENYIAIYVNGEVVSQPVVEFEIDSDVCIISGSLTEESAQEIAEYINSGKDEKLLNETPNFKICDYDGNKVLGRADIEKAEILYSINQDGKYHIQIFFTEEGRKKFKAATEKACERAPYGENYLMVYANDMPFSMPMITTVIDSDSCILTQGEGYYNEEVKKWVESINAQKEH